MQKVKTAIVAASTAAVLGAAVFTIPSAFAAEDTAPKPFDHMVDVLSSRFSLNRDEVQQVFEEEREKMWAEHRLHEETRMNEHLDQAVQEGKITDAQRDVIIAKREEMQALLNDMKDKTPEEKREVLQARGKEIRDWAEEQGIAVPAVPFFHPMHPSQHRFEVRGR